VNRLLLFVILSGLVLLFDLYAYQGLKFISASWWEPVQRAVKILFWVLTAITLLSFILYEPLSNTQGGRSVLTIIATIGVANILGKLLFAIWLLVADGWRAIQWVWSKLNPQIKDTETGISRNEFITGVGAVSATLPLLTMGWGVLSGAHDYTIRKRDLKLKNLPPAFEGYRIVQISDIHVGSFWSKRAVERGVKLINDQLGDAIFFTGDLVNNKSDELNGWTELFGQLKAPDGVFSILGNHDYGDYVPWDSPEDKVNNLSNLKQIQKDMGWDLLINENRIIEREGDTIAILGVENWGGKGRFPKYGDLASAYQGTENQKVKLLLSHDPSHWRGEVTKNYKDIDVTFSGHTHGMQFGIEVGQIKWSPVKYFYPEWADLYREEEQMLYVNRGFGYIGYPGRFGILPEITVFTLTQQG